MDGLQTALQVLHEPLDERHMEFQATILCAHWRSGRCGFHGAMPALIQAEANKLPASQLRQSSW